MRNWTLVVFINFEIDVKNRGKNGFKKLDKYFLSTFDTLPLTHYIKDFTMLYLPNEAKKTKLIPQDKLRYWQIFPDLNTFLKTRCIQDQKLSQSILCQLPREYTQKYYLERQLDVLPTASLANSVSEDQPPTDVEESKEEQNAVDAESAAAGNKSSPNGVIAKFKRFFMNQDKDEVQQREKSMGLLEETIMQNNPTKMP